MILIQISNERVVVKPLDLVLAAKPPAEEHNQDPGIPKLVELTVVRAKLAKWLPFSLGFTKMELIYSTNHYGRTLEENLYRHVSKAPNHHAGGTNIDKERNGSWNVCQPYTRVYSNSSCFLFRIVEDEMEGETNSWKCHLKEQLKKNLLFNDSVDQEDSSHASDENAIALLEQF
jgi:hypothetical protein